jgi:putative ATP-dependent endonuclease of the OLD family
MSLPPEVMGSQTLKPSWPWEWKDRRAVVPAIGEEGSGGEAVYVLRVSGTPELELLYEIVQPNGRRRSFLGRTAARHRHHPAQRR